MQPFRLGGYHNYHTPSERPYDAASRCDRVSGRGYHAYHISALRETALKRGKPPGAATWFCSLSRAGA